MALFDELAGSQPERLAHRALVYALRNDPTLMGWLMGALRVNGFSPADALGCVQSEAKDQITRWRTDITITWPRQGLKPARIELKLAAPPTKRQREAAFANAISLLVVPTMGQGAAFKWVGRLARVVTWASLAEELGKNIPDGAGGDAAPALKRILVGADRASCMFIPSIALETARAELEKIYSGEAEDRRWPTVYRFLNSIDYCINGEVDDTIRYLWTPLSSSRRGQYYGWSFLLEPRRRGRPQAARPWWLGFYGLPNEPMLGLFHRNVPQKAWRIGRRGADAERIAAHVVAMCLSRGA